MKVLDHSPHFWFLFEQGGKLLLDVNCSHSSVGYSWMIELSPEELAQFHAAGHAYLDQLAQAIHESAPILAASTSPYRARDVSSAHAEQSASAIAAWQEAGMSPGT